jgi:hypothetical protein
MNRTVKLLLSGFLNLYGNFREAENAKEKHRKVLLIIDSEALQVSGVEDIAHRCFDEARRQKLKTNLLRLS